MLTRKQQLFLHIALELEVSYSKAPLDSPYYQSMLAILGTSMTEQEGAAILPYIYNNVLSKEGLDILGHGEIH